MEDISYGEQRVNQLKAIIFKRPISKQSKRATQCKHCLAYFSNDAAVRSHLQKVKEMEISPLSYLPLNEIKEAIWGKKKKKESSSFKKIPEDLSVAEKSEDVTKRSAKVEVNKLQKMDDVNYEYEFLEEGEVFMPATPIRGSTVVLSSRVISVPKDRLSCYICNQQFAIQASLDEHIERMHSLHRCSICKEDFNEIEEYNEHVQTHEKKAKKEPIPCPHCPRVFTTNCRLSTHIVTHDDFHKRSFICDKCGKTFQRRIGLVYHMSTHNDEKTIPCNQCSMLFHNRKDLWKHVQKRHDTQKLKYKCHICYKKFILESTYQKHIEGHLTTTNTSFKCETCHKSFSTSVGLNVHLTSNACQKMIKYCSFCNVTFKFDETPCEHIHKRKIAASGKLVYSNNKAKTIPCEVANCKKLFAYHFQLHKHMNIHAGVKPFHCEVCGKSFSSKHYVSIHKLSHQEPRIECSVCNKRFRRTTHFQQHFRIHTGDRPYACEVCGRTFTQKGDMRKHMRSMHGIIKDPERPSYGPPK